MQTDVQSPHGAIGQDEANAVDLCYRSRSGIGASCVSSTHVKDKFPFLPSPDGKQHYHMQTDVQSPHGAIGRDEANAVDLCYRSRSGIGASCVSSTHVKDKSSLPPSRWVPPQKHTKLSIGRFGRGKSRIARGYNAHQSNTVQPDVQCDPNVCHVFKSSGNSSKRTQAGAVAHAIDDISLHHVIRNNRNRRRNLKNNKLDTNLLERTLPLEYKDLCWSLDDLNATCLVFDGGKLGSIELTCPQHFIRSTCDQSMDNRKSKKQELPWKCLNISRGELWVADSLVPQKGITHPGALFTRIPRKAALEMTEMTTLEASQRFCEALRISSQCQSGTLHRGKGRRIFSDNKYVCLGVQPNRASHGVSDATYHRDRMPSHAWDCILEMLKKIENALTSFVQTDVIRHLNHAQQLLHFKTMPPYYNSGGGQSSKIFGGIAFGMNIHLSCHTDQDYTYSIVSVHVGSRQYNFDDRIVAYFCFPRLGIAVALRPGDLLVFNPSEPHAVSSRCDVDDQVYCLSAYLKTAVVGLNDNRIELTPFQEQLQKRYNSRCTDN